MMTQEQGTQRRCAECGRFLSASQTEGPCPSCGATVGDVPSTGTVAETSNGTTLHAANGEARLHGPYGTVAVPIEPSVPAAPAPNGASASLSTRATRPPRGVVILRPSQLHPDAAPIVPRPPEPVAEPEEPSRVVDVAAWRAAPRVDPTPELLPRRPEPDSADWTIRIFVGVAIGVLVGVAVPFLLTR